MTNDRADDIGDMITAYQFGASADLLKAQDAGGEWGVWFSVPPCSPQAMEKAGLQFVRSRTQAVQHVRHALLKQGEQATEVVIVTNLPSKKQVVYGLNTQRVVFLSRYLEDDALAALTTAFAPRG